LEKQECKRQEEGQVKWEKKKKLELATRDRRKNCLGNSTQGQHNRWRGERCSNETNGPMYSVVGIKRGNKMPPKQKGIRGSLRHDILRNLNRILKGPGRTGKRKKEGHRKKAKSDNRSKSFSVKKKHGFKVPGE